MRPLRYCFALLTLTFVVIAGGPLGCELLRAPDLTQLATLKPPEGGAPDAPKAPAGTQSEGGMCCIRGTAPVEEVCGSGATRCCTEKYDQTACEDVKGSWFQTARGCHGAC